MTRTSDYDRWATQGPPDDDEGDIDTAEIETPKTDTITPRELRRILYQLDDQSMTVEQLRKALFDVDNQDEPLSIDIQMFRKWGVE